MRNLNRSICGLLVNLVLAACVTTEQKPMTVTGIPRVYGESAVLFSSRNAYDQKDWSDCRSLVVSRRLLSLLEKTEGREVVLLVENHGLAPDEIEGKVVTSLYVHGRPFEPWCSKDLNMYWVRSIVATESRDSHHDDR